MGAGANDKGKSVIDVDDDDDDENFPAKRRSGRHHKSGGGVFIDDIAAAAGGSSGSDDDPEEIINLDVPTDVEDGEVRFWKIKCKKTDVEHAVKSIRNKAEGGSAIKCAMAIPYCAGFVFVEAQNENDVKDLCRTLKKLLNSSNISPVSNHDMEKILRPDNDLQVGDYVRYNRDLAKLEIMDPLKGTASILVIPRLSIEELQAGGRQKRGRKSKAETVLPQKFITLQELEELDIPVKRKRDVDGRMLYVVGGYKFVGGYRLQPVSLNTLRKVTPTAEEIKKFEGDGHARNTRPLKHLEKGDKVEVVEGPHAGKIATFVKMEKDTTVYLLIDGKEYSMHKVSIRRHFENGSRVCVASGEHEGTTGIVTFVAEDYIQIVNEANETIDVPVHCVGGSSFVPRAMNKVGNYELHDLVDLADQQTFGMIIRIDKTVIEILKGTPEKVDVITAKTMEINKKYVPAVGSIAQDCQGNAIRLKDSVRVQSGHLQGKEGRVIHIMRGVLFVHDPKHIQCGGFFCVSASACFKLGGLNRPGEEPVSTIAKAKPRRHPLDRKRVRITRGPFKSYMGRVMRVFSTVAHIFLDANLKTVSVKIDFLKDMEPCEGGGDAGTTKAADGETAGGWEDTSGKVDAGWDDGGTATAGGWGDDGGTATDGGWGDAGGTATDGGWGDAGGTATDGGWGDAGGDADKGGGWGDQSAAAKPKAMEVDGGWGDDGGGGEGKAMEVDGGGGGEEKAMEVDEGNVGDVGWGNGTPASAAGDAWGISTPPPAADDAW